MQASDFPDKDQLTTAEALRFCRYRGWPISSSSLYINGIKFGFATKASDGHHYQFNRAGLSRFLMQKGVTPPPGYIPVVELAKKKGVNLSSMYSRIKNWEVETIQIGPQKVTYVSELSYERRRRVKERIPLHE
jgi:hypothetical protein